MGFVPAPQINLQSGLLYNLVVSLLVFIACYSAAYIIYPRVRNKAYPVFLFLLGSYWLAAGAGNLLAWLNLLKEFDHIAYILKPLMALPGVVLIYYLLSEIFVNRTTVRRLTAVFFSLALGFVLISYRVDGTAFLVTYWGVQWQNFPRSIYFWGILLPVLAAALYLILKSLLEGIFQKQRVDMTIYLGAVAYAFLEYVQVLSGAVTWPRLLARLFYILIAFGAYLYFTGKVEEQKFVPRAEKAEAGPQPRVSFFLKLLSLFIVLAVIPITISSLLMFISFKEIIDLYIYKPLLWNLKTSREAFLLALTHVQIQALFLMILTGLLVIVASVAVSRGIAESLRRISLAMARVSRGDFSFRLLPDSNDEIGDVVNYFNEMSLEIKRARDLMENWNRELETKVKERTEDLRKALLRLTELDRLKNEFMSMVSHELRTPVTSADGYVSLFLSGVTGALTDDQKKYLTVVKENHQRLMTLIDRLLDFSQMETGRFEVKRERVSMHELVRFVADMLGPQLEKNKAALSLKLEAQKADFMGDREKMGGVLINLMENALKFAREGERPSIEITTRNEGNSIVVAVADNGIGIEKEYLEKVFDKFYQVEDTLTRKAGGVGLGLALVKEIIGNHQGKIWAESAGRGSGSKFIFTIPAAEKA